MQMNLAAAIDNFSQDDVDITGNSWSDIVNQLEVENRNINGHDFKCHEDQSIWNLQSLILTQSMTHIHSLKQTLGQQQDLYAQVQKTLGVLSVVYTCTQPYMQRLKCIQVCDLIKCYLFH
jgi:hypothetical protein